MNKQLIAKRFSKASNTYPEHATVQQAIATKMAGLLRHHLPPIAFRNVLEVGCGTGTFSRLVYQLFHPERFYINDISIQMGQQCTDLIEKGAVFMPGDAEQIPFPIGIDLITSCSALQWFDTPAQFFQHCSTSLCKGGYLAFTTFGKCNMQEIRQLTGKGLKYHSVSELKEMLSSWFSVEYCEEEQMLRHFDDPIKVLYHLKNTGVTGTSNVQWTRSHLHTFCNEYKKRFGKDNKVRLTYEPQFIIAKKKEL